MKKVFLGMVLAAIAVPMYASAQDEGFLEEVVVTAQRREQSLQEVPVSVTAFTGDLLRAANMTEAAHYLNLTPNVAFTQDGQVGSRGISISMRGVSNINTDESSFIQSIGVYLDEFSVASVGQGTINPQLQDLERIEVLRGPQGTYFGRNAVGGALNLVTRRPINEFEGEVTLGLRDFDGAGEQYDFTGILNAPLSDEFFIRGVAYYEDSSGLVENIVPGGGDSGHEYLMVRAAARLLYSDRTTIDFMFMNTNEEQGMDENVPSGVWDTDSVATFFLPQPPEIPTPVDPGTGFWPNNQNRAARTALPEKNDTDLMLGIFTLSHQMNEETAIKWITGWIDTDTERVFDNDLVPENTVFREQTRSGESLSTEVRLELTKERYDWISGLLYATDKKEIDNAVQLGTTTVVNGVDFADDPPALPPTFLNDVFGRPFCLACGIDGFDLDSIALFTDFTLHATDKLDLTIGGRYTRDDIESTFFAIGVAGAPRFPNAAFGEDTVRNSDTFDDFSPRLGLSYQISDDVGLYGMVSKGYKAGGFSLGVNTGADPNTPINEPFKEETLLNYEIGLKSEWLDRRLRLNASAFYLDWEDLQLETFFFLTPGDPTSNIELTINVQDAEAMGFEIELAALPTENFLITAGVGVVDTEITSNDTARLSGNLTVNLQGEPLPRSPELTWNITGEYTWPFSNNNEFYLRGEVFFQDEQFSTIEDVTYLQTSNAQIFDNGGNQIGQIPDRSDGFPFINPDHTVVNLRAGFVLEDSWEFNFYVENATDEEYFAGAGENFGLSGFRLRPNPRVIGGKVSYRF